MEGGRKKVRAVMVGVASYSDGRSRGDELMRERI